MALISTTTTGGFSDDGSTYVGGVVPNGDNLTVVAGATWNMRGTMILGNDTSTPALTFAGTVEFSTVVDSDLTLKGTIIESGTAARWRRGTLASPMPAGVKSIIRTNCSATLANNKYNIVIGATNKLAEWSEIAATKNRQFQVAAAISAGATSITVSDATGWAVGDVIFLESTTTTATQREHRVLTSVSGNTVGWAVGLTNARLAGCWGGNLSNNVLWQSYSGAYGAYLALVCNTASSPGVINMRGVSFHGMVGTGDHAGFTIYGNNALTVANSPIGVMDNLAACDVLPDGSNAVGANALLGVRYGYGGSFTYPMTYSRQNQVIFGAVYASSGGTAYYSDVYFCGTFSAVFSQFSQGGVGVKLISGRITNTGNLNFGASMIGFNADNIIYDGATGGIAILQGDYTLTNWLFGQSYGIAGTPLISNSNNSLSTLTLRDCKFPAGMAIVNPATYQYALAGKLVTLINKNQDTTQQEIYGNTGAMVRDNAQLIRSRSSIKCSPYRAGVAHGYSFNVAASAGVTYIFRFGLRYDATYGTATPPSVTVSGLGITPQTFVAGGSAATDYQGTITVTPTSTGVLTIAISGQTTSTLGTGSYWFSGMSVDPWINWTQHYGYTYAPTSPTQTVDSVVQLSESAAAALTGLAYAGSTLTVSGTRTMREVYDWLKQYEASNRLAPILTSNDGKVFTTAASMAISGALSGGSVTAAGFALTGSVASIALTGNVAQATPTALANVAITGDLTYATSTPITVTLTSATPTVTGTISNTGSALVTVRLAGGTTVGTVGSNVVTQIVTSLTLTGLTAGSSIYVANASGVKVDYVASSGTSYTLDTTGGTGTWTYKIARYGYTAQTGTHTPATTSTATAITLVADPFVTQPTVATVAAYTQLGNPDGVYDYAAYFETTSAGIPLARIAAKAGSFCSVGSYPVTMATSGAVWAIAGGVLTLNTGPAFAPGVTMASGLLSTAAITAADASAFTGVLSDSTGIRAPLTIAPAVSLLGAQVHIYDQDSAAAGDLGTELAGTTSCAAASYTYYGPAGNAVWLQVLKDGYLEYGSSLITPSAASTISPTLEQDYIQ